MEKQNLIMGLWKFSDKVTIDELEQIAQEWAKEDEYTQLYIRKTSKDQNGIGFTYDLKDKPKTKESMDEYMDKTSDMLKRKFGNDLVGWDVSNMVYTIK